VFKDKVATFIYQSGRNERLNLKNSSAEEFFYGYFHLKKYFKEIGIIEFKNPKLFSFFKVLNPVLRKLSGLPFFSENLLNLKNLSIIKKSDILILTNQRVGFSLLPIYVLKFLFKFKSCVFIMGLLNIEYESKIKTYFRKALTKLFMNLLDKFIFLSLGEFEYAQRNFPKHKSKFYFLPFSIDTDFWNNDLKNSQENKNILFIGNDGKRDYEFVIELSKKMPDFDFKFITKKINKSQIDNSNVELISGKWDDLNITDSQIKEYYNSSFLTIIPIIESLQPSGQSVALQSLMVGTPVMITRTSGFWDPKNFINEENILFVEDNQISEWVKKINRLYKDQDSYESLVKKGKLVISKNYNLKTFNDQLLDILST
tara:strand:+ start:39856 stop:40968 length:1113 start_codon:yes stop_codon:yes gene_type:complete